MKICRACGLSKELTQFYNSKNSKTGQMNYCRDCWIAKQRQREIRYRQNIDTYLPWIHQKIKSQAKQRGVPFNITLQYLRDIWALQKGLCAVTKEPLTFDIVGTRKQHIYTGLSVDRIDNSKGYVEGNVQFICYIVNLMKTTMTMVELKEWCGKILND